MKTKTQPDIKADREHKLAGIIGQLFHLDLDWIGSAVQRAARLASPGHPVEPQNEPKQHPEAPTGPFLMTRKHHRGDILVWVPRRFDSYLIDDITGQYGYSHISIDCGEVNIPNGKPVMIESMVGKTVQNSYQDEYGPRSHLRIPLSRLGIDVEAFCDCVKSKVGEAYDALEALTLGEIDDPAKQVCSDLAAVCLPEEIRKSIARARRLGLVRRSAVSLHSKPADHNLKEFISPNGFAEYFGAPKGRDILKQEEVVVDPRPVTARPQPFVRHYWWRAALLFAVLGTVWLWLRNPAAVVKPMTARYPSARKTRPADGMATRADFSAAKLRV